MSQSCTKDDDDESEDGRHTQKKEAKSSHSMFERYKKERKEKRKVQGRAMAKRRAEDCGIPSSNIIFFSVPCAEYQQKKEE